MNRTTLRKILASEGLLPQKKVASKALARLFTDFYKGASRGWGPDPAERLDAQIRKAVHADLKKIMERLRSAEANFSADDVDVDEVNEVYDTEVTVASDYESGASLEEDVVLPTLYYVTGTVSVRPLRFEESYLADFLEDLYLLGAIPKHYMRAYQTEGKKKWNAFILKVMQSKEFQQALLRNVSRYQDEAHEALAEAATEAIEQIQYDLSNEGSKVEYAPGADDDRLWKIRADLVGVSRRGGSVEYTLKFTGVLDAVEVVDVRMEFGWSPYW